MINRILTGFGSLLTNLKNLVPPTPTAKVSLGFVPNTAPYFPPLCMELERNNKPYCVIVEGADISHARRVLEGELFEEMERLLSTTPPFNAVSWIALVRSLDGTAEGMAFSWLSDGQMRCERDRKRILSGENAIQHVGVALLIAKLRWMKAKGYWQPRREILTHYDPDVMASYRRKCGLSSISIPMATASVTTSEGNMILASCPFKIRELTF